MEVHDVLDNARAVGSLHVDVEGELRTVITISSGRGAKPQDPEKQTWWHEDGGDAN